MTRFLPLIALVLLLSCAAQSVPTYKSVVAAQSGVSSIDTDLQSAATNSEKVGQAAKEPAALAYNDASHANIKHAQSLVPGIHKSLVDDSTLMGQKDTKIAQLESDASSGQMKVLAGCTVLGLLIVAAGFGTASYTGTAARNIITAGAVLCIGSACLSLGISSLRPLLPYFIVAIFIAVFVTFVIELIAKEKALAAEKTAHASTKADLATSNAAVVEQAADTATHVNPGTPWTKATQDLLYKLVGPTAAAVTPPKTVITIGGTGPAALPAAPVVAPTEPVSAAA